MLAEDPESITRLFEHLACAVYSPITPPSLRVITIVAERGRPCAP
jgi:hypothetical protein